MASPDNSSAEKFSFPHPEVYPDGGAYASRDPASDWAEQSVGGEILYGANSRHEQTNPIPPRGTRRRWRPPRQDDRSRPVKNVSLKNLDESVVPTIYTPSLIHGDPEGIYTGDDSTLQRVNEILRDKTPNLTAVKTINSDGKLEWRKKERWTKHREQNSFAKRAERQANNSLPNFPLEFDESDEAIKNTITRFLLKNPNTRMIIHIPPRGDSSLIITDHEHQVQIPLWKINEAIRKGMGNVDKNNRELMNREITTPKPNNESQEKEMIKRLSCLTIEGNRFQTNMLSIQDERRESQPYNLTSDLTKIHDDGYRRVMSRWTDTWKSQDRAIEMIKILCNDRGVLENVMIWNPKVGPVVVPCSVFANALGLGIRTLQSHNWITELQAGDLRINPQTRPDEAVNFFRRIIIDGVRRRDIEQVTIKQREIEPNDIPPTNFKKRVFA